MAETSRSLLPFPTLCLVTDLGVVGGESDVLVDRVAVAVENGVNMVQIRAPDLDVDEYGELVSKLVDAVTGRASILVNPSRRALSHYDGVDGVQLGENAAVTVGEARAIYGENSLVGRSVHSLEGAREAAGSGADFAVLGTIFASATHPGGGTQGAGFVKTIVDETGLDAIGIGGISSANAGEVIANGARGVAVIRSILGSPDPGVAARELMAVMLAAQPDLG